MNGQLTLMAMLPEHMLLLGIIVLLTVDILGTWSKQALVLAVAAVAASAGAAFWLYCTGFSGAPFAGQFSVTPSALLAKALVVAMAIPVLLISRDDFEGGEFPALLLSSLYGVCLLISADSYLIMFLGLELMSIPVYVLILLAFRRPESAEAALKYLVLGGAATAMFLMGVSLLYAATGSMDISTFGAALSAVNGLGESSALMTRAAVVLMLLAFFLKAAVVPFHGWSPDAYETASIPVTTYMATIIKGGVLLAVVRLFADAPVSSPIVELLAIFPLISIVWGNLTAMKQPSFRRMMAYSSIAHAGYLFYAMLGDGAGRFQAVVFYVVAYGVLNVLAFAALPAHADDTKRDQLDTIKGLYHRKPFAALMIGMAMLSLAGLPPFPGFVAKFLIFSNVLAAGYTTYAVIGLVGSYLGIYFYLRVIQLMFMSAESEGVAETPARGNSLAFGGTVLCLVATVALMIAPGWLIGQL